MLLLSFIFFISVILAITLLPKTRKLPYLENLNVVLIVVDTLGTEHIGAYNRNVDFTPNIDKLAKGGVLFEKAYAVAPWTKPAIASMFSGVMPSHHGVLHLNSIFREKFVTMAEHFKKQGHHTAGIISHILLLNKHGYAQGFDYYKMIPYKNYIHTVISSQKVTDFAINWLQKKIKTKKHRKFFLFLHYFDPHYRYNHHPRFDLTSNYKGLLEPCMDINELRRIRFDLKKEDIDYLIRLHQEEIAYTDYNIGRFIKYINESDLRKKTLIIFISDHGEEFMRHGWIGHTRTLYNELIHVPLVFNLPGKLNPARINIPVSQIDLLPTLMSLWKKAVNNPDWEGKSLVPWLKGKGEKGAMRSISSEVDFNSIIEMKNAHLTAVIENNYKLIHDKASDSFELYNLKLDPEELKNIVEKEKERLRKMLKKLNYFERYQKVKRTKNQLKFDKQNIKKLKSLGYI